jgi:hypothetical protein
MKSFWTPYEIEQAKCWHKEHNKKNVSPYFLLQYKKMKYWWWDFIGRKWTFSQKFPCPWWWRNRHET